MVDRKFYEIAGEVGVKRKTFLCEGLSYMIVFYLLVFGGWFGS